MADIQEKIKMSILKVLDEDEWDYIIDGDFISTGAVLLNRLTHCLITIYVGCDYYSVEGILPIRVEPDTFDEVAELLHRINYEKMYGVFKLDYSDRKISFMQVVDCDEYENSMPSVTTISKSLIRVTDAFDDYGDMLLEVVVGHKIAEEVWSSYEEEQIECGRELEEVVTDLGDEL